jgi:tetratricopeptide (TPR) repeat protein
MLTALAAPTTSSWTGAPPPLTAGVVQRAAQTQQPVNVAFTSDVADTVIMLDGVVLGSIDRGQQLSVKLPPGDYKVVASHPQYASQTKLIKVTRRMNAVRFFMGNPLKLETAPPAETPTPTPAPTPPPAPAPTPAPPPPPSPEQVFARFLDPKQTDGVTAADWQSALSQIYQGLARDTNNTRLKVQAHFAQGQVSLLGNDFPGALVAFNSAANLDPQFALVHYGLGHTYMATKQPAEALKAYQRATQLDQTLGIAHKGLGDAYAALGKIDEANDAYVQARRHGYFSADASLALARNLISAKKWTRALELLNSVVAEKPSAEAFILIGDSYINLKQTINAFQSFSRAAALDPNSAAAHYRLGELQLRDRDYRGARESLERALALDPEGRQIDRRRSREMANEAGKKLTQ